MRCLRVVLVAAVLCSIGAGAQQVSPNLASGSGSLAEAQKMIERGDAQGAITMLLALRTAQPQSKGVAHLLGLAYYRTGKLIEAESSFGQAMQEDPGDKESVQLRGLTLYRLGRPAAAIPFLEQVRQWTPNGNADANYVLGLCYMNAQRYDEARSAFAVQYGLAADAPGAYLLLGNMMLQANLPEYALAAAKKASELNRTLPLAHFLAGEVYLYKADPTAALQEFTDEQQINPGYAPTYDRLGDLYTRTGKYQQAQESLTRAISLDRSSTGPFLQMGKVFLRRDDPQSAAMYLQHAEKMDPGNYVTHTLLAQAYRALGKPDEAKQEIDAASKIHAAGELKLQSVQ